MSRLAGFLLILGFLVFQTAAEEGDALIPEGIDGQARDLALASGLFLAEDPVSVYDFSISDSRVEFFLEGNWSITTEGRAGFTLAKGSPSPLFFASPPVLSQKVDLSSWILLDNTWYFESNFAEEFTKNTVAAGYIGSKTVRHVRAGNSGIVFPSVYPFVNAGGGRVIAPGLMASFAGESWYADAVIRYDAVSQEEMVLVGLNEVTETETKAGDFIRGRWFVLPDSGVTGSLSLYVKKGKADWRKLLESEFRVSGTEGIISLDSPLEGSLAVSYQMSPAALTAFLQDTTDGLNITPPLLAADFQTTIDGEPVLLLKREGSFSPFEILSRYRGGPGEALVTYAESEALRSDYGAVTEEDWIEVYRQDDSSDNRNLRLASTRYPLADKWPNLYTSAGGSAALAPDLVVRLRSYVPLADITLSEDTVPGSILVRRNGMNETGFTYDEESRKLTLSFTPQALETVRITWSEVKTGARNATLTAAAGAGKRLTDFLELKGASHLGWNISKSGYTDYSEGSPGLLLASLGLEHKGENASFSTAFAATLSVSDTTGLYRALGMDGATRVLIPQTSWYAPLPSSLTIVDIDETGIDLVPALYSPAQNTPSSGVQTTQDPSQSGTILILEAMLDETEAWTGADILTGLEGGAALSSASSVSISIINANTDASVNLYMLLGTENPDGVFYREHSVIKAIPLPAKGSGWKTIQVLLSEDERQRMTVGQNVRLLAVSSGASPQRVAIQTGHIQLTEVSFAASEGGEARILTEGLQGASIPAEYLPLISRFNPSSVNRVLTLSFIPQALEPTVFSRTIPPVPLPDYRSLSFFINSSQSQTGSVTVSLTGATGSIEPVILKTTLPPGTLPQGEWKKVSIDMEGKTVRLDGQTLNASFTIFPEENPQALPTRIEIAFDGWFDPMDPPEPTDPPIVFLIDEFHLTDTKPVTGIKNETAFSWNKSGPLLSAGSMPILSDPAFSSRFQGDHTVSERPLSNNTTPLRAGARTAFTLFTSSAEGAVELSNTSRGLVENTSYSVSIPLVKTESVSFTLADSYGTDFKSGTVGRNASITASVVFPLEIGITYKKGGASSAFLTDHSVRADTTLSAPGLVPLSLSLSSAFTQTLKGMSDPTQSTDAYKPSRWGPLWLTTLEESLSRGESDAQKRSGNYRLVLSHNAGPSLASTLTSSYLFRSPAEAKVENALSGTLTWPITLSFVKISPGWTRTSKSGFHLPAGGSWAGDSRSLMRSAGEQRWFFTQAPFHDLAENNLVGVFTENTEITHFFSNTYSLALDRSSAGALNDLWIPVNVKGSLAREIEAGGGTLNARDIHTAKASARLSALNTVGNWGAYPLFTWFDQDEISQIYAYTTKWGAGFYEWTLDFYHSVVLFLPDEGRITAENSWVGEGARVGESIGQYSDTLSLSWKRSGSHSPVSAFIGLFSEMVLKTYRTNGLKYSLKTGKTESTIISAFHELETGIGKNGSVTVFGSGEWRKDAAENIAFSAVLSITGKITY